MYVGFRHAETPKGRLAAHLLDAIESRRAVRVASRLGRSLPARPLHVDRLKAMPADLDEHELSRLHPGGPLPTITDRSIADVAALRDEPATVRRRGYAPNRGESEEGVASVAVAVATNAPGLRTALSMSAPVGRLPISAARALPTESSRRPPN
ncbi:IclR family transcriptional regulator C-terminal domain-containing protein [Streptomyces sp. NPDC055105]|uniref:IclR family transcriptional regulator domain-containing protein n=1 Tax=Streptomyces sp. NPDC055105 TaxID=3365719 RepID=UPI0037D77BCB